MSRPKPGMIYRLHDDGGLIKDRPVLIVSREEINGGDYVVTVPFYSSGLAKKREMPQCVFFGAGAAGLEVDCVAKIDEIRVTAKSEIDFGRGSMGVVSKRQMALIFQALDFVVGRV